MTSKFKISNSNSAWVFISGSDEPRHLYDIILGIDALRKKGYADKDIFVFADNPEPERSTELKPYNVNQNIFTTQDVVTEIKKISGYEHIVVVVTGHGNQKGIHSPPAGHINPFTIMEVVRSCTNVKAGVLVLGQCYAGLFNYTDAMKAPPLALLGATNLNPSLSDGIKLKSPIKKLDGNDGLDNWIANIFLYYFFEWLLNPEDVDGDGKITVGDAYRYAGVKSNAHLVDIKKNLSPTIEALFAQQMRLLSSGAKNSFDPQYLLELHTKQLQINKLIETLYLHQESWILHANLARDIEF